MHRNAESSHLYIDYATAYNVTIHVFYLSGFRLRSMLPAAITRVVDGNFVLPKEYVTCRGGKACLCGHALKIFVPSADGPLLNFHYSFHGYHQNQVPSSPTLSVSLPKLPIPGNWSWAVRLYVDVALVRTVWRVSCGPIRMSRTKQSTLLTYSSRSVV